MDTIIELLLPYLDIEDVVSISHSNKYWKWRIDNLFPVNYYLTINYVTDLKMSGSVFPMRMPLQSISNKNWKKLLTLNNSDPPEFSKLNFFTLSILETRSAIYNLYKKGEHLCWCSASDFPHEFKLVENAEGIIDIKKIEILFRLKS